MGLSEEQMNMGRLFLNGLSSSFPGFHLLPWTQFFSSCNTEHICSPISQYTQDPFLESFTFSGRALDGWPGCCSAKWKILKWSGINNEHHRPCMFLLTVWNDKGLKFIFEFFLIILWLLLPNTSRKGISLDVFT